MTALLKDTAGEFVPSRGEEEGMENGCTSSPDMTRKFKQVLEVLRERRLDLWGG